MATVLFTTLMGGEKRSYTFARHMQNNLSSHRICMFRRRHRTPKCRFGHVYCYAFTVAASSDDRLTNNVDKLQISQSQKKTAHFGGAGLDCLFSDGSSGALQCSIDVNK